MPPHPEMPSSATDESVVFTTTNGAQAGEAAATLRSLGIPAQWRTQAGQCVVSVPQTDRDAAVDAILRNGLDAPSMGYRALHAAAWAILGLLIVTGILVALRL